LLDLRRASPHFQPALTQLAAEFHDWAVAAPEARAEYDIEVEGGRVYVRGEALAAEWQPLTPPDVNWSADDLARFLQRHGPRGGPQGP
jgi:hypothetical protein